MIHNIYIYIYIKREVERKVATYRNEKIKKFIA